MNLYDTNFAAWMIGGGVKAADADVRNLTHIRALRASRSPSSGFVTRLAAVVAAILPAAAPADPDCSPA